MTLFRNASIRERLTVIIMAASTVSVLLTALTISVIGVYNLKENLKDELVVSATLVGDRNTAALLFNDDKLAENNMQVFSARRSVLRACLYDRDGKLFAKYFNEKEPNSGQCPTDHTERKLLGDNTAEVMQPVVRMGDRIGSIYIESDLKDVEQYEAKQTTIAASVIIAVLVVSSMLALWLQRGISAPILSLAHTARQVSATKDYNLRAAPFGGKGGQSRELRVLTDSFNHMLHEIGERERRLRQQNIDLAKAKDAAEAANRAKSQFLANISHELRTPLNAIIGFSSILMNQLFGHLGDEKYLEYSRDINKSGTHLLDIINDILDLARAEAGRLELTYEEINVARAVQKCLTLMAARAEKGKITLTYDVQKNLPSLVADRLRFVQIILNIVSNGIKFTPENGKVHIAVTGREVEGVVTHIVITVTDTGIGMTKEDISKAFQSFGQVDSDLNRRYEGTGLGLSLTRTLLELHGGSIEIESAPGNGTKVIMSLPVLPPGGVDVIN